jgi:hypothetical protein
MADYLEGDLALGSRALVDAHLDECSECATEIAGMRDTIALLHGLPEPEVPATFSGQVMRRTRAGEDRVGFVETLRTFFETLFSPRVLAPVSVAMIAAGVLVGTGGIRIVIGGDDIQVGPSTAQSTGQRIALNRAPTTPRHLGAAAASQGQVRGSAGQSHPNLIVMRKRSASPAQGSILEASDLAGLGRSGPSTTLQVADSTRRSASMPPATSRMLAVSPRTAVGIADESSGRSLPTADEWLAHLERNPADFADRLASISLAEHELWVDSLARHAIASGRFETALAALKGSPSQRARLLAEDFAAAAEAGGAVRQGSSAD